MPKYEELVKEKNKEPVDIDALAKKYKMNVMDVKKLKDDRGPLDLTRVIEEKETEINDLKIGHAMDKLLERINLNHSYYIEQKNLFEKNNSFEDIITKLKAPLKNYSNDLLNGGFKFENPQAERECGCGVSFSV